ncbi:MAG: STAS domain-containing protein [Myxococcota bacterium]
MFEFVFSEDEKVLTIRVRDSKFDITSAADFRQQVKAHWKPSVDEVVMDFSQVEFVDSSGVGALVSVHKRVAEKGNAVILLNPCPAVVSVIELLRLHRVFTIRHD